MCKSPRSTNIAKGNIPVFIDLPCRECWQCRANRVNDYVARCLCEAQYSDWTVSLTLTYRDSAEREKDLAHKEITPHHVQQLMRNLRKRSTGKMRYIVTGEYGTLKGRAHFHMILFGKGKKPEIPHNRNTNWGPWSHGYTFADWDGGERAIRYVCKYILKGEGRYWFSLSKKPPIGWTFFEKRAHWYAEQGVFPRSFEYMPPGGKPGRKYMMTGATRRDFLALLVDLWLERRPLERHRLAEWVGKSLDKLDMYQMRKAAEDEPLSVARRAFALEVMERQLTERQVNKKLLDSSEIFADD